QHRKYSHVTDEYSFWGSNASCTSLMSAMCSVPPGWGSALVADGPVVEPPVSPPPHATPNTAMTVASAMRIHLLDISSSSGIASDASTPTDPYGARAMHGTSVPCQGLSDSCANVPTSCQAHAEACCHVDRAPGKTRWRSNASGGTDPCGPDGARTRSPARCLARVGGGAVSRG